jgi:hypothetical protein
MRSRVRSDVMPMPACAEDLKIANLTMLSRIVISYVVIFHTVIFLAVIH